MANVIPLTSESAGERDQPDFPSGKVREEDTGAINVGLELCRARQRCGKTLMDVANQTKIAAHHLIAMERNRFAALPGRVYAVGYIRNYAACVGVDPEPLVARVKAEIPEPEIVVPAATVLPPQKCEVAASGLARTSAAEKRVVDLLSPQNRRWPQAATAAVLVAAGVVYSAVLVMAYREQMVQPKVMSVPPNIIAEASLVEQARAGLAVRPVQPQPAPYGADAAATITTPGVPTEPAELAQAVPVPLPQLAPVEPPPAVVLEPAPAPEPTTTVVAEVAPTPPVVRSKPVRRVVLASSTAPGFRGPIPLGRNYGSHNKDARIILRAHRPIHVAVAGPGSRIFLDQNLGAGDTYRVPNITGLKLSAPDAGAIEIILDDTTVGFAAKSGAPAKDLPLDPQSIIDRQNQS